jgi:hypothetical protein
MFGSNNCIEHPKDIRISLTKRVKKLHYLGKYIFQPKNIHSKSLNIHWLNDGYNNKIDLSEIFRLNHYPIQSKEFFEKVKMVRGDVYFSNNYRNLNCFDNDNKDADYEDNDLKNMILNNNTNNNHNYELEEEDCDEDCNKDILLKIFLKHRHIKF